MKKITKIISTFSLLFVGLMLGACSNDELLANSDQQLEGNGIPLTIKVNGGTSSRLSINGTKGDNVEEGKIKWTWSGYDCIYVINEKGRCLGQLQCGKWDSEVAEFHSDNINVYDGETLHFWYFGRNLNELVEDGTLKGPAATAKYDYFQANKIIYGQCTIDFSSQYNNCPLGYREVMSCNGIVKVIDGVATVSEPLTMKHYMSNAIVDFINMTREQAEESDETTYEYAIIGGGQGGPCKKVEISGVRSKAKFDLVKEELVSTEEGNVTVYLNDKTNSGWFDGGSFNWVVVPGVNKPEFYYLDERDIAHLSKLDSKDVPQGCFIGSVDDNGYVRLKVMKRLAPMSRQPYVVPQYFTGSGQTYVSSVFAKGNLYATNEGGEGGTKLEFAEEQYYTNDTDPKAKLSGAGKHDYEFSWLDACNSEQNFTHGLYTTENQYLTDLSHKGFYAHDYELNPGLIFKNQHSDCSSNYILPGKNDFQILVGTVDTGGTAHGTYGHALAEINVNGKKVRGLLLSAIVTEQNGAVSDDSYRKFNREKIGKFWNTAQYDRISIYNWSIWGNVGTFIDDMTLDDINNAWLVFLPLADSKPSYVSGEVIADQHTLYWTSDKGAGDGKGAWPYTFEMAPEKSIFNPYGATSSFMMRLLSLGKNRTPRTE